MLNTKIQIICFEERYSTKIWIESPLEERSQACVQFYINSRNTLRDEHEKSKEKEKKNRKAQR